MITLLIAATGLLVYMTFAFCLALYQKDNGVADIAYGCGFFLLSWVTYSGGEHSLAGLIATLFVTLWGLRLSTRIYLKNRNKPEDFRYRAWREQWGTHVVLRNFLQVFMLQGVIIYLIATPVMFTNVYASGDAVSTIAWIGIAIWVLGFYFEAVGDYQLDAFRRRPENKGHIMQHGLWKFTRHPNYFGESLMWWGISLIAFGTLFALWGYTQTLVVFMSPLLITYLLLKVSGIPLLEAHFSGTEWEAYKKRTNAFIPWFPRKN